MAFRMGFNNVAKSCSSYTFQNTPFRSSLSTLSYAKPQKQTDFLTSVRHISEKMTKDQLFTASSVVMAISLPMGLITAPSILAMPFDVALSLVLPLHMYLGTRHVIEDYAPKAIRPQALTAWAGLAALSGLGLLKIGLCGRGISYSMKSLWAPVATKEIKE